MARHHDERWRQYIRFIYFDTFCWMLTAMIYSDAFFKAFLKNGFEMPLLQPELPD